MSCWAAAASPQVSFGWMRVRMSPVPKGCRRHPFNLTAAEPLFFPQGQLHAAGQSHRTARSNGWRTSKQHSAGAVQVDNLRHGCREREANRVACMRVAPAAFGLHGPQERRHGHQAQCTTAAVTLWFARSSCTWPGVWPGARWKDSPLANCSKLPVWPDTMWNRSFGSCRQERRDGRVAGQASSCWHAARTAGKGSASCAGAAAPPAPPGCSLPPCPWTSRLGPHWPVHIKPLVLPSIQAARHHVRLALCSGRGKPDVVICPPAGKCGS